MRDRHGCGLRARASSRVRPLLAYFAICVLTVAVSACGGDDNSSSTSGTSTSTGSDSVGTTTTATTLAVVKPVVDCSQLAGVDLTGIGGVGSTITSATVTTATINGAAVQYCMVKGTLAPANTFQVALPVSTWTQRFAALGCGGLCGSVSDPSKDTSFSFSYKCPLVQQGGFVTAATDMGHTSSDATWSSDPQKQADFAYRGQHVTTLAAKKLIQATTRRCRAPWARRRWTRSRGCISCRASATVAAAKGIRTSTWYRASRHGWSRAPHRAM